MFKKSSPPPTAQPVSLIREYERERADARRGAAALKRDNVAGPALSGVAGRLFVIPAKLMGYVIFFVDTQPRTGEQTGGFAVEPLPLRRPIRRTAHLETNGQCFICEK
jgi:hypothetical protein